MLNIDETTQFAPSACGNLGLDWLPAKPVQRCALNRRQDFSVVYQVPVRIGKANFKRLTLDLGLGWETPLGADIFIYAEGRAWIPTTDYPSKYIFINDNAPLVGMINTGIRILF